MTDLSPPNCLFDQIKSAANAVLTFYLSSGVATVDPITGNVHPATNTPTSISATCHFQRVPQYIHEQYYKGQDQKLLYLRGRAVDPVNFPDGVGHLSEGTLTINGRTGKCVLLNPEINPYTGTSLGTHFYLVFIEGETV